MKQILTLIAFALSTLGFGQSFIWNAQTSPVSTSLNDVYFVSDLVGWAVGANGVIIKTTNGGQLWTTLQSGVSSDLKAVYFVNQSNGYAVGGVGSSKVAIATTDGGATWSPMTVGNPTIGFYDVAFSSLNHGIIIGGDSIYATSDAGATWVKEDYVAGVSGVAFNKAVACFNDSVSLVGGDRDNIGAAGQKAEIFDRRLWNAPNIWGTTAASNIDVSDRIFSLEVASPTVAFAGGLNGKVYRMVTDQINYNGPWTVSLDLNPTAQQIMGAISFPTANFGVVLTDGTINSTNYAVLYITSDGGANWSSVPDTITTGIMWSVSAPTINNVWAVGTQGKIYHGVLSIGIEEEALSDVRIYPNPANNVVTIEMNSQNNSEVNYSVVNITGSVLAQGTFNTGEKHSINIESYNSGVYFIKLESGASAMKAVKFVKN